MDLKARPDEEKWVRRASLEMWDREDRKEMTGSPEQLDEMENRVTKARVVRR